MPWALNDGELIEDPNGVSWTEAVKQQRAFYSNQARLASMYAQLDEQAEEIAEEIVQEVRAGGSELVRIEIGKEHDNLIASLSERMDAMSQQQSETQMALVAALHAIGTRESVVNVEAAPAPNVTVEAPPPTEVNVHVPEQPAPEIHFTPEINVEQPQVDVHMPSSTKTITIERDPLTGLVSSADVTEA